MSFCETLLRLNLLLKVERLNNVLKLSEMEFCLLSFEDPNLRSGMDSDA